MKTRGQKSSLGRAPGGKVFDPKDKKGIVTCPKCNYREEASNRTQYLSLKKTHIMKGCNK